MTLLLGAAAIDARRAIARGPLLTLADSLATDLNPLLDREPYIPTTKALLSRVGGRCEADGTDLEFDPTSPHAHRCPTCARVHTGEYHDRWWLYPYQLWLAERAVHAATLGAINNDERHRAFARTILLGYADRYLDYQTSTMYSAPRGCSSAPTSNHSGCCTSRLPQICWLTAAMAPPQRSSTTASSNRP